MFDRIRQIFGFDLRSLAVFRIALALMVVYDVVDRWPHLEAFYSDSGFYDTRFAQDESPFSYSLNYLSGSLVFQQAIFLLLAVAALALAAGLWTRAAVLVCWVLVVSIHVRNPLVLIGGDTLLRLMLFWSLFLPLGKIWSVDAWRRKRQTGGAGQQGKHPQSPDSLLVASAGTACYLFQVCIVYWCAGTCKLTETWLDGTVMEYIYRLDLYVRPLGTWALTQPWLLKTIAYAALLIELAIPFLLFLPFATQTIRLLVILVFWGLHVGIELSLDVGNFGMVSMIAWIPLVPSLVWNFFAHKEPRQEPVSAAEPSSKAVADSRLQSDRRPPVIRMARVAFGTIMPLLFLAYIAIWNYYGSNLIRGTRYQPRLPEVFFRPGWITMVAQNFQMFGEPPRYNPIFVFSARLKDGSEVDLIRGLPADQCRPGPENYQGNRTLAHATATPEWKKLHRFLLRHGGHKRFHQSLLEYYTRVWNRTHSENQQVMKSRLERYVETLGPNYQQGDFVRHPDLAEWQHPHHEPETEEELIDDVDQFLKSLQEEPLLPPGR